ncbi:helix-turn-helix domain-containing protein [Fusibacter sp. 3D3]|uniref:helix-turn-helix domain-containing protein n=1 Tax=Fusibacter sp. 3D3 TaxID=1048380 RepID=UPI000853A69E|nr:helix-turn-helix domain-containing protein [Fusibacter sp. 3D3]GAU76071.1 hypothetical protein F3D3_0668 [Fusibacter sp. 3D3]
MLGKLVRELRGLNISQRELAQEIGVSHSYISKLESNLQTTVSNEIIEKLASTLECDKEILYIACGKIPPDQLTINSNAPSIYSEIESYIRSKTAKINTSLEELEILFNAYNQSKTITFLVNYETHALFYMNISATLFLKKRFPDQNIDQIIAAYADEIIKRCSPESKSPMICDCDLRGEKSLIDLSLDFFTFKNQRFLLVQIFEERSLDRFNEFALFSENHFRGVFQNCLQAVFVFEYTMGDHYGALIHANQAACDLLGYTVKELSTFIGPQNFELQSDVSALRLKRLKQQKKFYDISIFKTKESKLIPVEVFSNLGCIGKNNFILMCCSDLYHFNKGKTDF